MDPQQPAGSPQQQVIERLKTAVNVLVTVSNNPSVDQLAAAIGFTLTLNKMGKHATAVFSGDVPSTIEFLRPEETLEKDTNSLRDFIVSLDKNKADKLRYKVEENVVKIFITPYRTSLSESDLNFSQGDFNVDAVVALGVSEREQLDQAIISHGRILHDATVITVSVGKQESRLGAINLHDPNAASLCEILVSTADALQPGLLDNQIATAYLTGIVAETERFRNEKTTPKVMSLAAVLMASGANQQLISKELEHETVVPHDAPQPEQPKAEEKPENSDGSLTIAHTDDEKPVESVLPEPPQPAEAEKTEPPKPDTEEKPAETLKIDLPEPVEEPKPDQPGEIAIDEHGNMSTATEADKPGRRVIQPLSSTEELKAPSLSSQFTANMTADGEDEPTSDPLSLPPVPNQQILEHGTPGEQPEVLTLPPAFDDDTLRDIEKTFGSEHITKDPGSTLNEIEEAVKSPHADQAATLDSARQAVESAAAAAPFNPANSPLERVNALPFDPALPQADQTTQSLDTQNQTPSEPVLPPIPNPIQKPAIQEEVKQPGGQAPPTVPPPFY